MNDTLTARHAIGSVVRITGDTDANLGRLGEIVSDTGYWYRLRIDSGVAVLFRHEHVEPAEFAESHALRVELRVMHVKSLRSMLRWATQDGDDQEVIAGLRTALRDARVEMRAARAWIM